MSVSTVSFQTPNVSMEELLNQEPMSVQEVSSGKIVIGKIVSIHNEKEPAYAIVSIGAKLEGQISLKEFDDDVKMGEEVEALVRGRDKETGLIILSKRELERRKGWEVIIESFEKELPVNGEVKRKMKQGYLVNVEQVPMFMPHSLVGSLANAQNKKGRRFDLIGTSFTVNIIELNHKRKTGIVSRKKFQDEQNQQHWSAISEKLNIGDIVAAKVVKQIKAGVFLEVENVLGFMHNNNISWERNKDELKEGLKDVETIQARVLEIDAENNRLSLGVKQLTEDPWSTVNEKYEVGQVVKGTVSFVANYGAFIDMGNGLEGLLHVTEMSWTRKVNQAREIVRLGQEIEAKIIGINAADKRISLGLRQMFENPWTDIKTTYKVGQVVKGFVKDLAPFGAFVAITDEIDGLIRKEDINWDEPAVDPRKHFKTGQEIEFKIVEINLEDKRIGCSARHLLPNPYKDLRNKYPRGSVVEGVISGVADFGVFIRFEDRYEGLVHINNLPQEQTTNIRQNYKKGDAVKAVVKGIDAENRKISLSIKDVEYALARKEMAQYIEKDYKDEIATSNPFATLAGFGK